MILIEAPLIFITILLEFAIVAMHISNGEIKSSWCEAKDTPSSLKFSEDATLEAWETLAAKPSASTSSKFEGNSSMVTKLLGNPVFTGADPDIILVDKNYWIYPTTDDSRNDKLFAHSSPDLKNWKTSGPILNMADIGWINSDGAKYHQLWAPGILHENNKYYLYYSVGPQNPTPSRIGVAVSDTPDGKFKDVGKPLITGGNGFESIDAMVFKDPKSGEHYLYCGGSAGSKLRVFKLNPDLTSINKEVPVENPQNFTEGAFMHYRDGLYYLSYSSGEWNKASYSVHYATSDSATGPWTYKGKILQSDEKHLGPGHHAFLQNPATGQWYIAYHRWNGAGKTGKMPPTRSVAIENLEYAKNGDIVPIKMTD